jgi:hypothetical protein
MTESSAEWTVREPDPRGSLADGWFMAGRGAGRVPLPQRPEAGRLRSGVERSGSHHIDWRAEAFTGAHCRRGAGVAVSFRYAKLLEMLRGGLRAGGIGRPA